MSPQRVNYKLRHFGHCSSTYVLLLQMLVLAILSPDLIANLDKRSLWDIFLNELYNLMTCLTQKRYLYSI